MHVMLLWDLHHNQLKMELPGVIICGEDVNSLSLPLTLIVVFVEMVRVDISPAHLRYGYFLACLC